MQTDRSTRLSTARRISLFAFALTILTCVNSHATFANVTNRYEKVISTRNVFALQEPRPAEPTTSKPVVPLTTVTFQGVTTILNYRQALLTLSTTDNRERSTKAISVVLREGEREGEVEVLKIDERHGLATIRNHGIIQTLALLPSPRVR